MGVAVGTVKRMEAGDPGVAIGTVAMCLLALGKVERLSMLLPEELDDIGMMVDRQSLPRRIRKRKGVER